MTNSFIAKRRQWLPPDYACKPYHASNDHEKEVIKAFEGERLYQQNLNDGFVLHNNIPLLLLKAA